MKGMGWTLIVLGVVLALWSCSAETSVHTDMNYVEGLGLQEAKDVLNLGLLQRQMMMLEAGLAAIIAGTIAVCVGELRDAMVRAGTAKFAPPVEFGLEAVDAKE